MKTMWFVWLVAFGCGGSDFTGVTQAVPMDCTPGEQRECSCAGGVKSVQVCEDDGAKLGACECADAHPDADTATRVLCGNAACGGQVENGSSTCVDAHCILTCAVGWKNCDAFAENGCECPGNCVGTMCQTP